MEGLAASPSEETEDSGACILRRKSSQSRQEGDAAFAGSCWLRLHSNRTHGLEFIKQSGFGGWGEIDLKAQRSMKG